LYFIRKEIQEIRELIPQVRTILYLRSVKATQAIADAKIKIVELAQQIEMEVK
jgi:hypothetical protein